MAEIERVAKRVTVVIRKSSKYYTDALEPLEKILDGALNDDPETHDPKNIIDIALNALKTQHVLPNINKSDFMLIVRRIFTNEIYIVFDIFHDKFDAEKAHLRGQDLTVIIVRISCKGSQVFHSVQEEHKVNYQVRSLFNHSGWESQPPFDEDFRDGGKSMNMTDCRDFTPLRGDHSAAS